MESNPKTMGTLTIPIQEVGEASDGYHTFNDLYNHRHHLFIALMRSNPGMSWRANYHADGTIYSDDWFVAGMFLPTGDISYHLPLWMWKMLDGCAAHLGLVTITNAPAWDGHTPEDVIRRLAAWFEMKTQ